MNAETKALWRANQRELAKRGLYKLKIDGDPGKGTATAVRDLLELPLAQGSTPATLVDLGPAPEPVGAPPLAFPRIKVKRLEYIGQAIPLDRLSAYLATVDFTAWNPSLLVVHHTAAPSLEERPQGFQPQHMTNLAHFYGNELKWSGAPHFFIDDRNVWLFNPLEKRGVHAVSFNRSGIGLEMLGDFDREDPASGRGLAVIEKTCQVLRRLATVLRLDPAKALRFHRDDPRTSKTCPGRKIEKTWFLDQLAAA